MSIVSKLSQPIDHSDPALLAFLSDLQGNILKGHGRHHTVNRFLKFTGDIQAVRSALSRLAVGGALTSAAQQLANTRAAKAGGPQDVPVAFLFLTQKGYEHLGVADEHVPHDSSFRQGMRARRDDLHDTDASTWNVLASDVDALLLVGMDSAEGAMAHADLLTASLAADGIAKVQDELGLAVFNADGEGIEHFGYVDGRSQPLLLKEDVTGEKDGDGTDKWNPAFGPIRSVLVRDTGGAGPHSYGSYFVFRKLEQNVKAFWENEAALAKAIETSEAVAGAMVVGRFRDGTPLVSPNPTGVPVRNNFNYDDDATGRTCPFHAHIRKTNPRGDVQRNITAGDGHGDRTPIMARRGIPFGPARSDDPTEKSDDKPAGGVGLLFMAYQRSLVDQFEFTQRIWANNARFVVQGTGIDPIIGQATVDAPQGNYDWPSPIGGETDKPAGFAQYVTLRGGEYFFAPSISFLQGLKNSAMVAAAARRSIPAE